VGAHDLGGVRVDLGPPGEIMVEAGFSEGQL
jgi:hypothetical protein